MDERLALCRSGVAHPGRRADLAVRVAFDNAHTPEPYTALGAVETWAGSAYPDVVLSGEGREGGAPVELTHIRRADYLLDRRDGPWVLVRLELGQQPVAGAVGRARGLATALVQMASETLGWRLVDGAALVRDGAIFGVPTRPPKGNYRPPRRPERDSTAEAVAGLDPNLVRGVLAHQPQVQDVGEVLWSEDA